MDQAIVDNRLDRIEKITAAWGAQVTRYGIVFLLLLFGAMKWTPAEAHSIQPLISHSPLWSWLYGPLGVQGTSIFFGVFEVAAGIAIALRPWFPVLSAAGSAFCVIMFLTTLSFLFTTPGLTTSQFDFILKDVVLLGGSIWTAGEALAARRRA
jgi:reactive chlorine resistance protein C